MGRLSESSVVSINNKSHSVTAEIVVPEAGAEGVIIARGGSIGGWSLYAKEGKLNYDGGGLGKGGGEDAADAEHLITAAERLRVAMARQ